MAAQAALIADTIMGMKRALRKEQDFSGPDDSITQPTNRGNKLKANAQYVREGALGYINSEEFYKQKIEHAGYTRYILQPNPVRYDSEGDELDEDDEDSEADAAAAEENPFSKIALEHLLCPIKHPSELPTHPSMSHAYKSKALRNMTQAIEDKLRQERALLWRARNLYREFLGDCSWMPCGTVETSEDRWIFEPRILNMEPNTSGTASPSAGGSSVAQKNGAQESLSGAMSREGSETVQGEEDQLSQPVEKDVKMTDVENNETKSEEKNAEQTKEPKSEEIDTTVGDVSQHPGTVQPDGSHANGDDAEDTQLNQNQLPGSEETSTRNGKSKANDDDMEARSDTQEAEDAEMQDGSPAPYRRMATRAWANTSNPQQEDGSSHRSFTPSNDPFTSLPTPHPLFLVPDSTRPDPNYGLPPNEAEDTRRLLWSYIQKQEETVRGFEHMLESLLRACRMKEDVLEWCKAEGHVGEMSDGEDWYDHEKWGLAEGEDLKKGADEDEIEAVDESRATGKRGRGRRA
ncbi:hypothetical protein SI65_02565 [Aspergillus cristatus]|uniref:Transcriptional regulatory protein RXT2 N-terminal domain-containing protein n=1 Tax=Aspergillus cristatus TaxID=573508 RepID=A0A1E3BLN7_ASPCR|nr:hypothetical protein SI65_02565 [Aspergillus cristatus]